MADVNEMELLREYADRNSESAFAELVRRHINLVYSVALRFTGNSGDAQDVTQAVFIILAQKAASLRQRTTLTGWLYETTRFTARHLLRTKARRQAREQEAYMQSTLNDSNTDGTWKQLAPLLEEAMSRLNEKERTLLALRFFENKTGTETAALLGIQEWAAHKRVNRAVEKLRSFFTKRGVVLPAAVLTAAISANSVQAAPAVLAKSITAVAITKGVAASGSTLTLIKGALKVMAWSKTKSTVIVGVGILLLGGGITTVVVQGKAKAKARADFAKDPVAYQFRNPSQVDANKVRQQLVGNWALESKRLGVDKNYTYYNDNNRQKMWTLTNWAIIRYGDRSNIVYSASGPYELQGDIYTETVEKATGIMTNYIGTDMQFRLRVDGDKYYQTALGDKPGLQEIGHRLPQ